LIEINRAAEPSAANGHQVTMATELLNPALARLRSLQNSRAAPTNARDLHNSCGLIRDHYRSLVTDSVFHK
jgi:hypothetical protein